MVLPSGGGESLGEATARIRLDYSGVQAGMQNAQNTIRTGLQNIRDQFQSIGGQIQSIGTQVSVAMAPVTAFGVAGVRAAANFDEAMTAISARTGLTGESLQQVSAIAQQLGADTVFSSQQAADAFLQMLTAGLSVEQAMSALPNVLNAAAASGEDLGRSADLVTNIMSSFRLEAGQTEDIVEALSRAAASSPASMSQIGEAMQEVGGLATGMGVSMNETAAIMAIFAQNGIRGSNAGTALRSMLLNMNRDTADVNAAWQELGTSMFDANGNTRDLNDVFQELDASLSTRSAEDQQRLITTLAGSYGLAGFNALRAGISIEEMQATMEGQASAADVASARMDSFKGIITSLRGSIETLQIAAFTPFMNNVLRPLGSMLIERVNQITAWVRENPKLTQTIVTVLSAISALAGVMIPLGFIIATVGGGLATVAIKLTSLLSPIGLVIGSLFILYRAWQTNTLHIRDLLMPVVERVQTVLERVTNAFQFFNRRLRDGESVWNSIRLTIQQYTFTILRSLGVSDEFASSIRDGLVRAFDLVGEAFNRVSLSLRFFWLGLDSTFNLVASSVGIFTSLRLGFGQFISNMLSSLGVSQRLANDVEAAYISAINGIERAFNRVPGILGNVRSAVGSVFGFMITAARDAIDGLRVIFSGDFVGGMFSGASEDSPIVDFWFNIRETILRVINAIKPPIASFITFVRGIFNSLDGDQLRSIASTIFEVGSIILSLTNPLGIVMNILRFFGVNFLEVFETVAGGVTTFFDTLNNGGGLGDAIGAVFGGGGGAGGGITDFFSGIVSFVTDTVIPGLNQFRDWFLTDAMPAIVSFVQTTVIPMIGQFFTFLASAWDIVAPALVSFANWFMVEGLPAIVGFITGTVIPTVQTFIGILFGIWEAVAPGLIALAGWFITDALPVIVQFITGVVAPAIQFMTQVILDIWTMVGPSLGQLFNWFVTEGLPGITNFLSTTVIPAITTFIGILNRIWTDVQPYISQLFDWFITTGLPIMVGFVEETVVPAVQLMIDTLSSIWNVVGPVLESLYNWFINEGLPAITGFIEGTATDALNGLINLISSIWASVEPGLILLRDGFDTVFTFIADNVVQPVIDLVESIVGVAEDIAGRVEGVIGGISSTIGSVGDFISDPFGAVGGALGFADGGRPPVGVPSLVGERGPELFVPDRGGTIVPNDALAGLGGTTNHYSIQVSVPEVLLRDTPNLEQNANIFAKSLNEELARYGE